MTLRGIFNGATFKKWFQYALFKKGQACVTHFTKILVFLKNEREGSWAHKEVASGLENSEDTRMRRHY